MVLAADGCPVVGWPADGGFGLEQHGSRLDRPVEAEKFSAVLLTQFRLQLPG
jgi:hypothetical protein